MTSIQSISKQIGCIRENKENISLGSYEQINRSKDITDERFNRTVTKQEEKDEILFQTKLALKEAMEQNEILRERLMEMEAMYSASQDEIERKNKIIVEIAQYVKNDEECSEEDFDEDERHSIETEGSIIKKSKKIRKQSNSVESIKPKSQNK